MGQAVSAKIDPSTRRGGGGGEEVNTVGDDMPVQMARCRKLLSIYKELGPSGTFGHAMIEAELREADAAVMSGDIVRILRAYQSLKGCE
jgi:hypothetical protein